MYIDAYWSARRNYEKKFKKPKVPYENKLCNIHVMGHNVTSKAHRCFIFFNVSTWKDFEDILRGKKASC